MHPPSIPHDPSTKGNSHSLMGEMSIFPSETDRLTYVFNVFEMGTSDLGHHTDILDSLNWKKPGYFAEWDHGHFFRLTKSSKLLEFMYTLMWELKIGSNVSPLTPQKWSLYPTIFGICGILFPCFTPATYYTASRLPTKATVSCCFPFLNCWKFIRQMLLPKIRYRHRLKYSFHPGCTTRFCFDPDFPVPGTVRYAAWSYSKRTARDASMLICASSHCPARSWRSVVQETRRERNYACQSFFKNSPVWMLSLASLDSFLLQIPPKCKSL